MNPHTQLVAELLLVADKAETKAQDIRYVRDLGGNVPYGTCEDHRTEIWGDVLEAIDRSHPGLGTRLQNAMHPLTLDEAVPA